MENSQDKGTMHYASASQNILNKIEGVEDENWKCDNGLFQEANK